jgi:hypothetical protein
MARVQILMTAYRRPQYTRKVLESWSRVRGIESVPITIFLEPSDRQAQMLDVIKRAQDEGVLNLDVQVNERVLGVDVNIAVGAEKLFRENAGLDYLIFAEDDLIVSDDVLAYMRWADEQFRDRKDVLVVNAHTDDGAAEDADPAEVVLSQRFRCWVWATWRDRWEETLLPTWDYDTSTSEYPGDPCDWAWNLDLRVIPRGGHRTVLPAASRSQNIGKWEGVHADPGLFVGTFNPSFWAERGVVEYRLARELPMLPVGERKHHAG